MARPKKFKTETIVVSFRIPANMEIQVRETVSRLISFGMIKKLPEPAKSHAKSILHAMEEVKQIEAGEMEAIPLDEWLQLGFKEDIEKYEKEIEVLLKTGSTSVLTKKRIEFCQNKIYELKRKLNQ